MNNFEEYQVQLLSSEDLEIMKTMLNLFGQAFEDIDTYCQHQPKPEYLTNLLGKDHFIALALMNGEAVVGGLVAYELQKFEQERSEIYIYDLAVAKTFRREGVATTLIQELKKIAAERGAYVIFVQADHGDDPAIELYTKFGVKEDVFHFDINVPN